MKLGRPGGRAGSSAEGWLSLMVLYGEEPTRFESQPTVTKVGQPAYLASLLPCNINSHFTCNRLWEWDGPFTDPARLPGQLISYNKAFAVAIRT